MRSQTISIMRYRSCFLTIALFFLCATASAQTVATSPADDAALGRLAREVGRLAGGSGGVVGVSAIHLETGRRVSLNGGERFPMASTFKVPVAVQLLTRVDKGEVRLDQMVELQASDLHPGSGTLTDLFNKPGLALSVRNLLELMMLISDNSATDVLVRMAGGPQEVTARMRELGIGGIDVNRPTDLLIADWLKAPKEFEVDSRDTSTPDSMADLLARIYRKDILKQESADLLLDIMRRCRTGGARLKGILPKNTVVAHKTGTIGGSANDVGIMTLPDGGHVAIAVFVKSSTLDTAVRERVIAEIARAVYDFFLFLPK
jgi:beta-lactamase class A